MPDFNPTVKIDMTGLNRGIEIAQQYSRRSPAEACNTAGYWVAVNTKNAMPAVNVGTVDSQLSLVVVPKIGKRGRPLKRGKAYSGSAGTANQLDGGAIGPRDVPLAALIVAARAKPGSRYNTLTNARYALSRNPFAGVTRAAGRAAMRALVDKMAKGRRSSVSFLKATWVQPVKTLKRYVSSRYSPPGSGDPSDGNKQYLGGNLGHADPAKAGGPVATCVIASDVGTEGKNRASMDRAQQTIGAPILQAAIDREGRAAMQYYLDKSAAELEKDFNAAAS